MQEQELLLFESNETYSLLGLKDECMEWARKKFPHPVRFEDLWEYQNFLNSEANLEFANRLRKIADDIEKKEYSK